jgi:hypothetical protein
LSPEEKSWFTTIVMMLDAGIHKVDLARMWVLMTNPSKDDLSHIAIGQLPKPHGVGTRRSVACAWAFGTQPTTPA